MDKNKIYDVADDVAATIDESREKIVRKAGDYAGKAQEQYEKATDTVRDMTTQQPITSLLVACGVGVIIGALLARR